jgi:hypothetical protein
MSAIFPRSTGATTYPWCGDFVPTAAQQAVADVIDVLEAAADTLDEALVRAEREGTFDPRAGGSP